jgi:hypothetical protein
MMPMKGLRDPGLAERLFGASQESALALLRAAWPAAVGPELARRTEVVTLDRGVLRVRVPDQTWRRGLVRMREDILARLRRIAGGVAPRALGFVEGPVALAAQPRPSQPTKKAPLPPALRAAAEAIPDPELRERFLAAATLYLGRFSPEPTRAEEADPQPRRSG